MLSPTVIAADRKGESDSSSSDSQTSSLEYSGGRSSPATSDSSFTDLPSNDKESGNDGPTDEKLGDSGQSSSIEIVPPSKMRGYIIFGVQGARRLYCLRTRIAQIDMAIIKDDDSFFDDLRVQYKKLRGYCRYVFSIWVFRTCEFNMVSLTLNDLSHNIDDAPVS